MKSDEKTVFLLACIFLSCLSVKAFAPEEHPGRRIKIVNVEKKDGRRSFLGLFGEVRYDKIECQSSVKYVTNPVTGKQDEIVTTNYICEGPGGEKCRHSGGVAIIELTTGATSDVDAFMDTIVNLLLDQIDEHILDMEEYTGSINKLYKFDSPKDGKPCYFNAIAVWREGNEKGDARITIRVYDVTDEMSELLH